MGWQNCKAYNTARHRVRTWELNYFQAGVDTSSLLLPSTKASNDRNDTLGFAQGAHSVAFACPLLHPAVQNVLVLR